MCSLPAASQTHDQKTVLLVASSANELMFKHKEKLEELLHQE
jgi:hypothetical protein